MDSPWKLGLQSFRRSPGSSSTVWGTPLRVTTRISIRRMPQEFRGAPLVSMMTWGSYHSGNSSRVAKLGSGAGSQRSVPGRAEDPGRGVAGGRAHLCFPGHQSDQSLPNQEMETPAWAHTLALCHIYADQNSLPWSITSAPKQGTLQPAECRPREGVSEPAVHTASASGVTRDPHSRGLQQVLW